MIEIIIETTIYPKKNWGISKMEEFLTKEIVSTGDIRLGAFVFFENSNVYDYLVIGLLVVQFILVIKKSDSRLAVVRFCWSLVWLQTELDSTWSYHHYVLIRFSALSCSFPCPILNNYLIEN